MKTGQALMLFCEPILFDFVIPSWILFFQDLQWCFVSSVQIKEVVLDLVTGNKLSLELRHCDRSLVFEPSNELTLGSIGKIDSFFVKICLSEVGSIHYR